MKLSKNDIMKRLQKMAFVPPPPPPQPAGPPPAETAGGPGMPMDPAMMAPGAPMPPASGGDPTAGMPPMDPAMMGQMIPAGAPPAGVPMGSAPQVSPDIMTLAQIVVDSNMQMLQRMDTMIDLLKKNAAPEKPKKSDPKAELLTPEAEEAAVSPDQVPPSAPGNAPVVPPAPVAPVPVQ